MGRKWPAHFGSGTEKDLPLQSADCVRQSILFRGVMYSGWLIFEYVLVYS